MSIDDKVVAMSFEQGRFATGVNDTIHVLEKLKTALKFPDAGKGLEQVDQAANKVNLGHITSAVDGLVGKFGALNVAALAVFSSIAIHAAQSAATMVKSFTLQPITQGFQEYATNLNAIQTILANTQASGAGLKDVNAALNDLNKYSDKTIYNFSEMARNIGTFTAAGVDLKTSTGAIKGIANLAALSGSNAEQASTAMYQLSQAISSGRVSLQDWNSVVNAGMGGTVFQRALATTAVSMGKLKDSSLKLVGPMKNVSIHGESFRQSIQSGPGKQSWLTSDVLTKTLQQFTGDLTNAQLKAQGFNDAQIKSIQATAKTAQHAATEVKTITQVLDVAKETAGSGWAQTFALIFGNFGEAKKTFTALSNAINGLINRSAKARNKILADWKALGGRAILLDNIRIAFHNLGLILDPIKKAFRDIFPRKTGQDLLNLTAKFAAFAQALKPSTRTLVNLRNTFEGFFAIFDIGKQVFLGVIHLFERLFGVVGVGKGGFLDFTGSLGLMIFNFDKALKKGNEIEHFFNRLGDILSVPLKFLVRVKDEIGNLFSKFSPGGFFGATKGMAGALEPLEKGISAVYSLWLKFVDSVKNNSPSLQDAFRAVVSFFQNLGPNIAKLVQSINWEVVFAGIRTGLLLALTLMFRNIFGKGKFFERAFLKIGFGKYLKQNIAGAFGALTGTMRTMQNNLRAKTLKEIAIAVALLTASVVAISFVDPKRVNTALASIAVMLGQLIGAMVILNKATTGAGFIKLPFVVASLVALAGAIDLLSIAVYTFSRLSWDELKKGLGAVAFLLAAISISSIALSKNSAGMIRSGIAINVIAVGLNILAAAVAKFGAMDLKTLAKGLLGVAFGLDILVLSLQKMPRGGVVKAASIVILAEGLKILADAVREFGRMDLKVMAKGLGGIGIALVFISEALRRMPWNSLSKSAGLLILAYGLQEIAKALKILGGMSPKQIAKSLVTLSLALDILSISLNRMKGTVRGSVALSLAAAGLALLIPAIIKLGHQDWKTLITGFTAFAVALAILGGAAKLLEPGIPALLGFGAAMLLVGAGLALAGAGIALIGIGLSAIAIAGPAAIGVLVGALEQLMEALPRFVKNLIQALLAAVQALAKTAPQFVAAIVTIVEQLLDGFIKIIPKAVKVFEVLLAAILKLFYRHGDEIIQAGIDVVLKLLEGLGKNIGTLVKLAGQLIVNFLNGIASKVGAIIDAGANIVIALIVGIKRGLLKIINRTALAIVEFLEGVANAIEKYEPRIILAFVHIGEAIVKGLIKGLTNIAPELTKKLEDLIKALPAKALKILHIGSPSKVFEDIGQNVVEGLHKGLSDHRVAVKAVGEMSDNIINEVKDRFNMRSPSKVMENIGKDINRGFVNGLRGSASDVKSAFTDLNDELLSAASDARDAIKSEQDRIKTTGKTLAQQQDELAQQRKKLAQLEKHPKKNAAAIKEANRAIQQTLDTIKETTASIVESSGVISKNQKIIDDVTSGHIELTKSLRNEKAELIDLSKGYEQISKRLDAATQALHDAKQTRKDAFTEYRDQYSQLPEISYTNSLGFAQDPLDAYTNALADQITALKAYHKTLGKLRELGLDDASYKKLLSDGTVDQKFADELLAGGKTAIDSVNKLDADLKSNSVDLAHDAASALYDAGVAAAQGLVDGLRSKKSELASSISFLAKQIVSEMKTALGIKSPSTVFAAIGLQTGHGFAQGLIESSKTVTDAIYMVSNDAMGAMGDSLSNLGTLVSDNIDPNPTITPVLDLSQVRKGADQLGGILTASASKAQASSIATTYSKSGIDETPVAPGGTSIKLEQNNYSPEAIDPVTIYRRTRTQLAQLRSLQ